MPNPVVGNVDTLRPDTLAEYVGQPRLKRRLGKRIAAAVAEERPLRHMLLCGPPGAGKTSLASLVATAVGDPFMKLQMPVKENVLARVVEDFLGDGHLSGGVLLLDEVHRLKANQAWLLPLLEFGEFHLSSGRVITNHWLTVIGATTERDQISGPLWDRFGFCPVYEDYTAGDLALIGQGMARKLGLDLSRGLLEAIGAAAGGVPRNVKNLIEDAADLMADPDSGGMEPTVDELLDQAGRTSDGLTDSHIEYMVALWKLGGTAGMARIRSMVRLEESVLLDLERLLIERKLLEFGPKGRELTTAGRSRARFAGRAAA